MNRGGFNEVNGHQEFANENVDIWRCPACAMWFPRAEACRICGKTPDGNSHNQATESAAA